MSFARKRSIARIREDLLKSADLDMQVIERAVPKHVPTEQKAPGLVRMVAGFVFIRPDQPGQVLVGVRRRDTNRRHPGVISVPTIRIPEMIASELRVDPREGKSQCFLTSSGTFGQPGSTESTAGLLVELVLAKKMIDGAILDQGLVSGRCALRLALRQDVNDPGGVDGCIEDTLMLTIVACWDEGVDHLPVRSGSYSPLAWVPASELITSWDLHDGLRLFPDADPLRSVLEAYACCLPLRYLTIRSSLSCKDL
jgi:hypothetical protein